MSITKPITVPGPVPARARAGERTLRLAARAERLATRRAGVVALAVGMAGAVAAFLARPTYPNYDMYYSLVWGRELLHGRLPDYDVFLTPTPHPLTTLAGAVLSLFGPAADRIAVLLTMLCFVVLLALLFRFTQLLLGTLVAMVAVAVMFTRTDIEYFAFRAVIDPWFLALMFGAAVLELQRPRRGWPVLALLAVAGLLRPEAWIFSGIYFLYLAPALPRRRLVPYAALAGAGAFIWLLADFAVTGDPLYAVSSTSKVAGEFGRQKSLPDAVRVLPNFIGGNEKIVTVGIGSLGSLLALWLLRARAALPLAMMAIGIGTFLAISAAGLSVIKRYLIMPSLLLSIGVALAFAGWLVVRSGRARQVTIALAVLAALTVVWRLPSYVKDAQRLNAQTWVVRDQHQQLKQVLAQPSVASLIRTCGPITVPNHSAIPVIRYETGLGKRAFRPAIGQSRPPRRGLLVVATSYFFESTTPLPPGTIPTSIEAWWANYPLSDFRQVAANQRFAVYENCA